MRDWLTDPITAVMLATWAVVLLAATAAPAQATASSAAHFMLCPETADGGACASATYKMEVAIGAGAVGKFSASSSYKLLGGINAAADTPVAGTPWLSGARPYYVPLSGGTVQDLHGHNLALGLSTAVTVGGKGASVGKRTSGALVIKTPAQTAPGYKAITATNAGGTAHLGPRGIGVLPLIELDWPIHIGEPWKVTYRGTKGDILYIAVTSAKLPFAAPIGAYHHGFELNLGAFIGLIGPLPVTSPDGTLTLDFPGFLFIRPIYVQMLALPSVPAGYNPGCFTNTIAL